MRAVQGYEPGFECIVCDCVHACMCACLPGSFSTRKTPTGVDPGLDLPDYGFPRSEAQLQKIFFFEMPLDDLIFWGPVQFFFF